MLGGVQEMRGGYSKDRERVCGKCMLLKREGLASQRGGRPSGPRGHLHTKKNKKQTIKRWMTKERKKERDRENMRESGMQGGQAFDQTKHSV